MLRLIHSANIKSWKCFFREVISPCDLRVCSILSGLLKSLPGSDVKSASALWSLAAAGFWKIPFPLSTFKKRAYSIAANGDDSGITEKLLFFCITDKRKKELITFTVPRPQFKATSRGVFAHSRLLPTMQTFKRFPRLFWTVKSCLTNYSI